MPPILCTIFDYAAPILQLRYRSAWPRFSTACFGRVSCFHLLWNNHLRHSRTQSGCSRLAFRKRRVHYNCIIRYLLLDAASSCSTILYCSIAPCVQRYNSAIHHRWLLVQCIQLELCCSLAQRTPQSRIINKAKTTEKQTPFRSLPRAEL